MQQLADETGSDRSGSPLSAGPFQVEQDRASQTARTSTLAMYLSEA